MSEYDYSAGAAGAVMRQHNRVLRNTYLMLALSLVPTIFGALAGLNGMYSVIRGAGLLGAFLCLGVAYGLMYLIHKNKDSGMGVALLLVFTFFMGVLLSGVLTRTLGLANGGSLVALAAFGTAAIVASMSALATSSRNFDGLGKWALAGVVVLLVASIANIFLKLPALHLALCVVSMIVFSMFLLYDVQKVVNQGESNYIVASLSIYLDIYNIFTSILDLLGFSFGDKR